MQQTLSKRRQLFEKARSLPIGTKYPVLFRTYSRHTKKGREGWDDIVDRALYGLAQLGDLNSEAIAWLDELVRNEIVMPSGRWLWCGGSPWLDRPENYYGGYNCTSINITSWKSFGIMMGLSMMGCGTGAVLQSKYISKLPAIRNLIDLQVVGSIGAVPKSDRLEETEVRIQGNSVTIVVGDSRQGWVSSYQSLLELSSDPQFGCNQPLLITVDLSNVRPGGEPLEGFGGVANPVKLPQLYGRIAKILNSAVGRQLLPIECCLLLDEAAITVVAGAIRRSAGMREFDQSDPLYKENLWIRNTATGAWSIDPDRDALRMANHTRLWETKPTLQECIDAVESQINCGEGAIMWMGECLARANCDLLPDDLARRLFIKLYDQNQLTAADFLCNQFEEIYGRAISNFELEHRMSRVGLNPCLAGDTLVRVWQCPEDKEEPDYSDASQLQMIASLHNAQAITPEKSRYWVCDGNGKLVEVFFKETRTQARMVRVVYRLNGEDKELVVTSDHEFLIYPEVYPKTEETTTRNPIRCKIADLQAHPEYGDRLMGAWGQPMCRVMKVEHLEGEWSAYSCVVPTTHSYDLEDIHTPNCGEIIGCNFLCNLTEIHLNKIAFWDLAQQEEAFTAGGVMAAILLRHQFDDPLFQESRNLDPIVGVSFTGLFDFFVFAFGYEWLQWWQAGRPDAFRLLSGERDLTYVSELPDFGRQPEKWLSEDIADYFNFMERSYLQFWKEAAHKGVAKYCNEADIPCPNRCTTVQPAGTKSLLTGASPGWHPPKGNWFDRSITFSKADPVALACLDAGYKITPGESDKDAHGNLLPDDAIWDEQCQTWLVVIPCQVLWAEVFEGKEVIDPNQFSAVTQFKFAMQVQNWYVTHNTSATVEARKHEAVALATAIYDNIQKDEGYVSTTILSRFEENSSHPRMPFQPLTKERYVERCRETNLKNSPQEFLEFINRHSLGWTEGEGPAGCDSDACLTPALKSQVFAKIEVDL